MAVRLIWLAHGRTEGMRDLTFGDRSRLTHPELVQPWAGRLVGARRGPEPACQQSATALGVTAAPDERLADVDPGCWRGCTLAQVMEQSPADVSAWLADATAAPHGGESLADLVRRIGSVCDGAWPEGSHLLVVAPLVARAAAVHALGVDARTIFRIDLAPLQQATMTRSAASWRLTGLGGAGTARSS